MNNEIKLEVGKTYEARGGRSRAYIDCPVVKILEKFDTPYEEDFYFLGHDNCTYREDGTFLKNRKESQFDLVREVTP